MAQFGVNSQTQSAEDFMVSFDFTKTPITQIADYIIIAASKNNASDIHFDPREAKMVVRFRIDGDLQDYTYIPKAYERNLITRLKLLANMNITETRLPQDGAIKGTFGDTYLDMRVSCLPLNEGEKIVIRILDYTRSLQGIESLGFNSRNLEKLKRMMGIPNGIILVTGATGSGKSTTTYSILQGLNKPETNIITVEDPIEMNIQGINQVQVNAEIGMTFAAALRSILRQDPNIILIGEIRDSETAQIAVRASITGHLVLSTIHTNNSLSTIERLLDMDVERYLLSTALTGIISQRLAKKLCPNCRFQRETTQYEKKVFKKYLSKDVATIWDVNPKGCEHCRKGYKGRIAVQEVLELDDDIRNALNNEKLEKEDLAKMVYTNKTITMLQDALGKVLDGLTSFEEVYRVIEIEADEDDYSADLTKTIKEDENKKDVVNTNNNQKNNVSGEKTFVVQVPTFNTTNVNSTTPNNINTAVQSSFINESSEKSTPNTNVISQTKVVPTTSSVSSVYSNVNIKPVNQGVISNINPINQTNSTSATAVNNVSSVVPVQNSVANKVVSAGGVPTPNVINQSNATSATAVNNVSSVVPVQSSTNNVVSALGTTSSVNNQTKTVPTTPVNNFNSVDTVQSSTNKVVSTLGTTSSVNNQTKTVPTTPVNNSNSVNTVQSSTNKVVSTLGTTSSVNNQTKTVPTTPVNNSNSVDTVQSSTNNVVSVPKQVNPINPVITQNISVNNTQIKNPVPIQSIPSMSVVNTNNQMIQNNNINDLNRPKEKVLVTNNSMINHL